MIAHPVANAVSLLRQHFSRLAALVLLVWLFAAGAAFAQACASTAHLLCEECCAEIGMTATVQEQRQETVLATHAMPTCHGLAASSYPVADAGTLQSIAPSAPDPLPGRPRIPIFFLRLAW
jgi:hypothetical protein